MRIHGGSHCYSYIELRRFRKPRSSKDCGLMVLKTGACGISDKGSREPEWPSHHVVSQVTLSLGTAAIS